MIPSGLIGRSRFFFANLQSSVVKKFFGNFKSVTNGHHFQRRESRLNSSPNLSGSRLRRKQRLERTRELRCKLKTYTTFQARETRQNFPQVLRGSRSAKKKTRLELNPRVAFEKLNLHKNLKASDKKSRLNFF